MPSAMVTFNGRITLPSDVRKQLGLKTGDNVDFVEIEEGRFAIVHGPESQIDLNEALNDPDRNEAGLHAASLRGLAGVGN
ncbi:MAG: AbrB/MazE/SpoVT family DNA-binding domain-containing protein [Terracidiphilus sp.]|jgi:AbrB family looped-hinge helix DNA binding protein